ncbi:hypothetical protein LX36DRAFT_427962 [Colletotrichum falcatum]|nr:hypothetical protein LX36DRAFT_427962 [Colletotrichum falcatum]
MWVNVYCPVGHASPRSVCHLYKWFKVPFPQLPAFGVTNGPTGIQMDGFVGIFNRRAIAVQTRRGRILCPWFGGVVVGLAYKVLIAVEANLHGVPINLNDPLGTTTSPRQPISVVEGEVYK